MFTGLIKAVGVVRESSAFGKGRRLTIDVSGLGRDLGIGQSLAVNGVCLTVVRRSGNEAAFEAVEETASRTNLGSLVPGSRVNLEPALCLGDALDGHIVQGHVDDVGVILSVGQRPEGRIVRVSLPNSIGRLVAEKGSIAIDGISLTVAVAGKSEFSVAVIPHTWENTTLCERRPGDRVNLEADVLARYAARRAEFSGGLDEAMLRENGFL